MRDQIVQLLMALADNRGDDAAEYDDGVLVRGPLPDIRLALVSPTQRYPRSRLSVPRRQALIAWAKSSGLLLVARTADAHTALVGAWQDDDVASNAGAVYVFTETSDEPDNQLAARMFSPGMGLGEDPATGSAAAALLACTTMVVRA